MAERELFYQSLDEFVRLLIAPLNARPVGPRMEYRWSDVWWRNPEARFRLKVCWRAFEQLRWDNSTGMHQFLTIMDYHMRILTSVEGPFRESPTSTETAEPLPCIPMPPRLDEIAPEKSMTTLMAEGKARRQRERQLHPNRHINPATGEVTTTPVQSTETTTPTPASPLPPVPSSAATPPEEHPVPAPGAIPPATVSAAPPPVVLDSGLQIFLDET